MSAIETRSSQLDIEDEFAPAAPARMVLEIAYGRENPADIAARYGYGEDEFASLCTHPPFRKQVEAKVAELKASGYSFRMKAALAAEDLLEEVYKLAMHKTTGFDEKLDALKFVTKMGDLEPKQNIQAVAGTGFSITINLADQGMPPKRPMADTIPADVVDVMPNPTTSKEDEAPPVPVEVKPFEIPQMTMEGVPSPGATLISSINSDLSGGLPV